MVNFFNNSKSDFRKISVHQIRAAAYNPRVDLQPGDPAYEQIKRSIETFGLVVPLVWNEYNGVLVSGHQRLKILVAQGVEDVEVRVVNISDLGKEKDLNLALNKISGDWDMGKLGAVIADTLAAGRDPSLSGFSQTEVDKISAGLNKAIESATTAPEPAPAPVACPNCGEILPGWVASPKKPKHA